MTDALKPQKPIDNDQEQAVYYFARERRGSLDDPVEKLFRTHGPLGVNVASVDTGTIFPSRVLPITFATTILTSGVAASGIVFEFGDSTTGLKLAVDSGSIYVAAGDAAGNDGIAGSVIVPAVSVSGAKLELRLAIRPGSGEVRLFIDGDHALRLVTAAADMANGWASTAAGAIGAAQQGTSTQRGQTINGAPSDFALVESLSVYQNQIPRQFD